MKRRYITFLLGIAVMAVLSGCNGASTEAGAENAIEETTFSTEEEISAEDTEAEQAEAQEDTMQEETQEAPEEPAADTTVYGNTAGNIMGGGLFLEDDDYFYLYHGYDNCV